MAEAISKLLVADIFKAYSARTEIKPKNNQDAVAVIKDIYSVDMNQIQKPKLLSEFRRLTSLYPWGNVTCPYLPCQYREEWEFKDSTGKDKSVFVQTAVVIQEKVLNLKKRIKNGSI